MMKKILLFFLLIAMAIGGKAQEIIFAGGGGGMLNKPKSELRSEYGFAEARLMINLAGTFRIGPYGNIVYSGGFNKLQKLPFYYRGRDLTLGLSIDSWGSGWRYNRYFWLNAGYRWSLDRGSDGQYDSWQKGGVFVVNGGFRINSLLDGWFGNHLILIEYQTPLSQTITALYKGDTLQNVSPYNKGRFYLSYENGLKSIPIYLGMREFRLEPLISLGFIYETATKKSFFEGGIGLSLGSMLDYYREWGKFIIFINKDLGSFDQNITESQPILFGGKIVINLNLKLSKNN